jgi:hypothetical protein
MCAAMVRSLAGSTHTKLSTGLMSERPMKPLCPKFPSTRIQPAPGLDQTLSEGLLSLPEVTWDADKHVLTLNYN